MPHCPKCHKKFPEGTEYCTSDGELLVERAEDIAVAATAYGPADVRDTHPEDEAPLGDTGSLQPVGETSRPSGDAIDGLIGKVLGGVYRVESCIGVGGMGVVYKVEHVNLEKEFALKVLGQIAQEHPDAVDRFRQEAISASHIEHDNIVDIITLDWTTDGNPYIVMELLRGESLADALRASGPMPLERALPIVFQICRALHAAHEAGIIHRDLKPENVFLTPRGDAEFVKILDFGISKIHDAEHDRVRITKTGQMLGTPLYMSPEQAKGESNLDRRVDIYSLAVILFEMLEGRPPFDGENYFQLIWKHSNEAPPQLKEAPPELGEVVHRALGKEPSMRYATMLDFEEAIAKVVPDIPPPAFLLDFRPSTMTIPSRSPTRGRPVERAPRRWVLPAAIGLSVALAAALFLIIPGLGAGEHARDQQASLSPGASDGGSLRPTKTHDAALHSAAEAAPRGDGGQGDEPSMTVITLSISSHPEGAEVFIDERLVGHTPIDLERQSSAGVLNLKLVKSGYRHVQKQVTLDQDQQLVIPLSRERGTSPPPQRGGSGETVPPIKTVF